MKARIPAEWQFLVKFTVLLAVALLSAYGGWKITSNYYLQLLAQEQARADNAAQAELQHIQKLNAVHAEQMRLCNTIAANGRN